ncbi:hypothetical protein F7725_010363 [Dissostichus mawsoni]|uniref:Uncharacterized protein n=1 Tax=Dissostichus mawsoni TaxID=36200 RepID=A0A7J5XN95_DISMA|nr:hypothetical protein F7725_010363 [Dissostichus mawsoni]
MNRKGTAEAEGAGITHQCRGQLRCRLTRGTVKKGSQQGSAPVKSSDGHPRPGKKKKRAEEKKATVCCSTFEASLSGLAAWSCVSKPRRAFHPLCCPRISLSEFSIESWPAIRPDPEKVNGPEALPGGSRLCQCTVA